VDFDAPLATNRPGVHDLTRHIGHLERTLAARRSHPAYADVSGLAAQIMSLTQALPPLPSMPAQLIHGDPKISNVIFHGDEAVCLVDLDTITRQPVALELGDALRSWCNPEAEDSPDAHFSLERFAAALAGYRQAAGPLPDPVPDPAMQASIADATLMIAVELAARFAADALNESYFGWDSSRFASASAHNRARTVGQLRLAESMRDALRDMRDVAVTKP
jgi:Ser/Thr protein kinase RdoA (MazF antagonist)